MDQDRLAKADPEYIKLKKKEFQDQIKALDDMARSRTEISDQAINVLNKWYGSFKQLDRVGFEDHFNLTWIEDKVIPDLKAVKCYSLDKKEILGIFQDHYNEGKVLIDVRGR